MFILKVAEPVHISILTGKFLVFFWSTWLPKCYFQTSLYRTIRNTYRYSHAMVIFSFNTFYNIFSSVCVDDFFYPRFHCCLREIFFSLFFSHSSTPLNIYHYLPFPYFTSIFSFKQFKIMFFFIYISLYIIKQHLYFFPTISLLITLVGLKIYPQSHRIVWQLCFHGEILEY